MIKILEQYRFDEEPDSCCACTDEYNGVNYLKIRLVEYDLDIGINLCDECLKKLKCK
jgi:hypothetical protein